MGATGANFRLSATCSVTSARSPELRQSLTARDAVLSSHGRRLATATSHTTSAQRPAATQKSNKFLLEEGELLQPFPPRDTTITTLLPFHWLPSFNSWFGPVGYADNPARVDHVASKQTLGRVRHWHFHPSHGGLACHVNHRPSQESSTHAAEKYDHFAPALLRKK
jgi:hypothetical protein